MLVSSSASAQTVKTDFDSIHDLCQQTYIEIALRKDNNYLPNKIKGMSVQDQRMIFLACGMYLSGSLDTIKVLKEAEKDKKNAM